MALPVLILSAPAREAAVAGNTGGYRPGGTHRPFAAALSLAIAGGVGATLMLALVIPEFTEKPTILIGREIPVPPPPTPIDDVLPPDRPAPRTMITATPPIVDIPRFTAAPMGEIIIDRLPPTSYVPIDFGNGGGGAAIEQPAVPVFRIATRDPRFADRFQPAYPSAMERQEIEGRCPVSVTIAPSGRVSDVRDNGCANESFFNATRRQALSNWRFRAATRDGVAVESTQDIAVKFEIRR